MVLTLTKIGRSFVASPEDDPLATLSFEPVKSSDPKDPVMDNRFLKLFSSSRSHCESASD